MEYFVFVPYLEVIPEWKEYYYDYEAMNQVLDFVVECKSVYRKINKKIYPLHQTTKHTHPIRTKQYIPSAFQILHEDSIQNKNTVIYQAKQEVKRMLEQWTHLLLIYSDQEASICYTFIQYKSFQILDKFREYQKLINLVRKNGEMKKNMVLLASNLYIQAYYLQKAISYNIYQQHKTYQNLLQVVKQEGVLGNMNFNVRMRRFQIQNREVLDSIAHNCGVYQNKGFDSTYETIKNQNQSGIGLKGKQPLAIGFAVGALIMLVLIIPMNEIINGISIKTSQQLRDQFPIWRGAAYWLLYSWLIGCDFLFFETSQINYNLLFNIKGLKMKSSKQIFLHAAIFSFIYIGLFILFIMEISGIINVKFQYFGQVFWILFFGYVLIPNPFKSKQSGMDFIKLLALVIISPLPGQLLNFPVLWFSDQFISLNQPMSDLFYTICYSSTNNASLCLKLTPDFSFGYIITIVVWRVAQVVKICLVLHQSKSPKLWDPLEIQWIALWRAFFGLATASASFIYRLKVFNSAFTLWIVVASISTIVSWFVDVKGDWGFMDYKNGTFLRQKLLFPNRKSFYYSVIISDFFLRGAWALSLSPFVLSATGLDSYLYVMMTACLEITRRCMSNIFRMGNEHMKNCKQLQVTIRDTPILTGVREFVTKQQEDKQKEKQKFEYTWINLEVSQSKTDHNQQESQKELKLLIELQKLRRDKQLQLLKDKIQQRKRLMDEIKVIRERSHKNLIVLKKIFQLEPLEHISFSTQTFLI